AFAPARNSITFCSRRPLLIFQLTTRMESGGMRTNRGGEKLPVSISCIEITACHTSFLRTQGCFPTRKPMGSSLEDQSKPAAYSREAARFSTIWRLGLAKAREEYSAMGHTRVAPITLKTNATFMRLKSAKTSRA